MAATKAAAIVVLQLLLFLPCSSAPHLLQLELTRLNGYWAPTLRYANDGGADEHRAPGNRTPCGGRSLGRGSRRPQERYDTHTRGFAGLSAYSARCRRPDRVEPGQRRRRPRGQLRRVVPHARPADDDVILTLNVIAIIDLSIPLPLLVIT